MLRCIVYCSMWETGKDKHASRPLIWTLNYFEMSSKLFNYHMILACVVLFTLSEAQHLSELVCFTARDSTSRRYQKRDFSSWLCNLFKIWWSPKIIFSQLHFPIALLVSCILSDLLCFIILRNLVWSESSYLIPDCAFFYYVQNMSWYMKGAVRASSPLLTLWAKGSALCLRGALTFPKHSKPKQKRLKIEIFKWFIFNLPISFVWNLRFEICAWKYLNMNYQMKIWIEIAALFRF